MSTTQTQANSTDTSTSNGTGAAADAKTPRETRNNHKAAEGIKITNAQTAQQYHDQVMQDTANDKQQPMFNGSGFTTPAILARHDPANLLRMSICISAALAAHVANDGEQGEQAKSALAISSDFAKQAGVLQEETRQFRTLLNGATAGGFTGDNDEAIVNAMLKGRNTNWAAIRAGIRKHAAA
jgi:hypothetical protein